jgi:hypothetical protein
VPAENIALGRAAKARRRGLKVWYFALPPMEERRTGAR